MNLSHRGITLRQLAESDMPFLFRLFADPRRCHLWLRSRDVLDEREFYEAWSAWTAGKIGAKFLVERGGEPLGLVYEYKRMVEDGHTKVSALLDEDRTGAGFGAIATALMIDWLFRSLPLRKVYMEVYGYNPGVAAMLGKVGAVEEAVLKEDRFFEGRYWDLRILAIHRDAWPVARARVLGEPMRADSTALKARANGRPRRREPVTT